MFFEGSEKKVEIVVAEELNLLELDRSFWEDLVKAARASILSYVENSFCNAFLLSESSLFVWKDRLVLITCGQTTLVEAIDFFVSRFSKEQIASLIFQRKNEYFSHLQKSSFIEDVKLLEKGLSGKAYRFGKMHEHHNFLYSTDMPYNASEDDKTNEILMYDISGDASAVLNKSYDSPEVIRNFLNLEKLFPGYLLDDHAFSPQGYSVNAIKDQFYFTIHITPEEFNSYVSFETNEPLDKSKLSGLLEILKPETFDIVSFNHEEVLDVPQQFHKRTMVREKINLGYDVIFSHFYNKETVNDRPYILELKDKE